MHFGNAYTNGDTVVYFPNLKVVAVGDLYAAYAQSRLRGRWKPGGLGTGAGAGSETGFRCCQCPAHGPAISRADLEALRPKSIPWFRARPDW